MPSRIPFFSSDAENYVRDYDGKELTTISVPLALLSQGQHGGLKSALTKLYCRKYTTLLEAGDLDHVFPGLKEIREAAAAVTDRKEMPDWFLLTINVDESRAGLKDLQQCVTKLLKKKWIVEWHYAIEQRGKTVEEVGKGVHAHVLIKRSDTKTKWSEISRECKNTCQNVCDASNPSVLNFRKLFSSDDVKKSFKYINGSKKDEWKQDAVNMNSEWRQENGLQDLYSSEPPSFLLGGEPQPDEDLAPAEKNVDLKETTNAESFSGSISSEADSDGSVSEGSIQCSEGCSRVGSEELSEREYNESDVFQDGPASTSQEGSDSDRRFVQSTYSDFQLRRRQRSDDLTNYRTITTSVRPFQGQQQRQTH